jgi:hypothetical protein
MELVQVSLKVSIAHLVAGFELSKVLPLLLYGIIREMNEFVTQVVKVKLSTARADVPILVEVTFQSTVDRCDQSVHTEVKFAAVDQQWIVDVLLNDVRTVFVA